jgi:hypothetical protein
MKSEAINELATALAKAQGEMTHAAKDRANPHFKSSYATLASVWEACRGPLSKHGLSVTQLASSEQGCAAITTILMHSSGQWVQSETRVPTTKNDAQGVGSAITYARRYALSAIVGIAPDDDDDDGNGASQRPAPPRRDTPPPQQPKANEPRITKGPAAGKFMRDATDDELHAFGAHVQAVLDNPAQAASRDRAIAVLNQIEAELVGRGR